MNALHLTTHVIERISPALARVWARRLFFSPRRRRSEAVDWPGLQSAWLTFTGDDDKPIRVRIYSAGAGPSVMLVHGWEGAASSFNAMARELLEAGFRVLSLDGPAHGMSPGSQTNLAELANAIVALGRLCGTLPLTVAHSFGSVVAALAMDRGLRTNAFISVAAPSSNSLIVDQFQRIVGVSDRTKQHLHDTIQQIVGLSMNASSLAARIAKLNPPGLIIHDEQDRLVPFTEAQRLTARWPRADLLATRGLGHSRILRDASVIENVVATGTRFQQLSATAS